MSCAIICNAVFIISNRIAELQIDSGVADDELVYLATSSLLPDVNMDALRKQDIQALSSIPGVKAASSVNQIPFGGNVWGSDVRLDANQIRPTTHASLYMDDGQLLQTYGMQVTEGRAFNADEYLDNSAFDPNKIGPSVPAIMLGRSLAQSLFPGQSAIGKLVYVWGENQPPSPVVGIVSDVMTPGSPGSFGDRYHTMIFPIRVSNGAYALRTTPDQRDAVLTAAVAALHATDPNRIIEQKDTLSQMRADFHRRDRAVIWLLLAVCIALLAVTAFGIIGLASFWVQQRTKQIGIRRALGATQRHILRYFQVENFILSSAGIVLGLLLAYSLNMLLMSRYELPRLPLVYLPAAAVLLWILGQIAVFGPARRAAAIPPAVATRSA
ncbi:Macrolide export ATP-binding/permease protein MacB [compost metagenome]